MLRFLVAVLLCSASLQAATQRPLKSYFAKLQPQYDQEKVMAAKTQSGWAISSDLIIGPYNRRYVGAFEHEHLTPRWWIKSDFDLTAPITVAGQFVLLGYRDGSVQKVDINTGKVEWTTQLGSYVARSPILAGSHLFLVTIRQQLYSVDFQSGEIKWFYEAGIPEDIVVEGGATPVVEGNVIYFGTSFGEVHAINTESGQVIWKKDPKFSTERFVDVIGDLFIYNNKLYLTRYDGLVASLTLGLGEPQVSWSEKLAGISTSSFRNGRLYVATLNGDVIAFELVNGRQVWRFPTGVSVASLNVLQESLVALGNKGRLTFINIDNGTPLWHDDLYGEFSSVPVIYKDNLYIFSGLGSIYGYKL